MSATHLPNEDYLKSYYNDTFSHLYGVYNEAEEYDITFTDPDRFVRHLLGVIPVEDFAGQSQVRILDFGGGDGTLAYKLALALPADSSNITIVDYGENIVDTEEPGIKVEKLERLDSVTDPFNIVIASASLEHVPHVEPVIRKLVSLLKPGGYMYVRTPYIVPMKRIFSTIDIGYPAHIHDMGADYWNRFPEIYSPDMSIIKSQPSIVQITAGVNL